MIAYRILLTTSHEYEEDNAMKKIVCFMLAITTILFVFPAYAIDYTTNTDQNVKNGNSGVYSYRSEGGTYYNYWIIDFDEGYVYSFSDGNGSGSCDRLKIESGDLNNVLIITYHDGGDVWSYGLHFKWKNQPDHLILQDDDGFEYDFYTTNLNDALSIMQSKTVHDY